VPVVIAPRPAPAKPPGRKRWLIAGAAALLVLTLGIVLASQSGSRAAPGGVVEPEDPASARERRAAEAWEALRGQNLKESADLVAALRKLEAFVREWDRTPSATSARREAHSVRVRLQDRLDRELIRLDQETLEPEGREEFGIVLKVLGQARARYDVPVWGQEIERRIKMIRGKAESHLTVVLQMGTRAKTEGSTTDLAKFRARVLGWGMPEALECFDREVGPPPTVASTPAAPSPPAKLVIPTEPAPEAELREYRISWERAVAHAAARELDVAVVELRRASRTFHEEEVRREAALDLELLSQLMSFYEELQVALSKWKKGRGVSLERRDSSGNPEVLAGPVVQADRDRMELKAGKDGDSRFVEYADLTSSCVIELSKAANPAPDRTLALLHLLGGNPEAAFAQLGRRVDPIPAKYWIGGHEGRWKNAGRDPALLRQEQAARELFYAAEREYRSPRSRGQALEKYSSLRKDFGDLSFVIRLLTRISARVDSASELYFLPADLGGGGSFQEKGSSPYGKCWTTLQSSGPAEANRNFVEAEFHTLPDTSYRCWILAGACCEETFVSFYQASDLTSTHPQKPGQMIRVEPASDFALPLRVPLGLPKAHGGKDAVRWEWIELPLPRYRAPGLKKIRVMTHQQGFSLARVLVSSRRSAAPGEADLRDLERSTGGDTSQTPDSDLVARWSFDEGSGNVAGDSSGNGHTATLRGDASWGGGKNGRAVECHGKDGFALVADASDLRLPGDLTISLWVKPVASRELSRLFGKGDENYGLWLTPESRVVFRQFDASGRTVVLVHARRPLQEGRWAHVAVVVEGDKVSLFIGGTHDASGTRRGTPSVSPAPLTFGFAGHDGYASAMLDEVRLYGRALSGDQLGALAR
jgi:hypothetical protein